MVEKNRRALPQISGLVRATSWSCALAIWPAKATSPTDRVAAVIVVNTADAAITVPAVFGDEARCWEIYFVRVTPIPKAAKVPSTPVVCFMCPNCPSEARPRYRPVATLPQN
jgi:hypothetical protein